MLRSLLRLMLVMVLAIFGLLLHAQEPFQPITLDQAAAPTTTQPTLLLPGSPINGFLGNDQSQTLQFNADPVNAQELVISGSNGGHIPGVLLRDTAGQPIAQLSSQLLGARLTIPAGDRTYHLQLFSDAPQAQPFGYLVALQPINPAPQPAQPSGAVPAPATATSQPLAQPSPTVLPFDNLTPTASG